MACKRPAVRDRLAPYKNMIIKDKKSRPIEDLRISVTDRCNFRCSYCMPKEIYNSNYSFLKKDNILSFEEILRVVKVLNNFHIKKSNEVEFLYKNKKKVGFFEKFFNLFSR